MIIWVYVVIFFMLVNINGNTIGVDYYKLVINKNVERILPNTNRLVITKSLTMIGSMG